jgi:hypothetical protein
MKVTVNNTEEKEIDWSKKGQLVYATKSGQVVTTDGNECNDTFAGFCHMEYRHSSYWVKSYFKPFKGSITLEND